MSTVIAMATGHDVVDHLEAVIANVPGTIYRCRLDDDWTMDFISDGIEHLSGYPAADFISERVRTFASVIHPDDRDHVQATVAQAVAAGLPFAPEYRILRRDGSVAWVLERGRASNRSSDGSQWLDGVIFDVTERRGLEEELRRSLAEGAAAQERLHLARDLHDAVGHALIIGVIQAGGARTVLRRDPATAEKALQEVEASLRGAMREMREMVSALHHEAESPPETYLRLDYLIASAGRAGLDVHVTVTGDERPIPAGVQASLYRSVQECLTNCAKYAAGARVTIDLSYIDEGVSLAVTDDGSGCAEPATVMQSSGRGLEGIRHRAAALAGTYAAHNLPGGGFRVAVTYPAGNVGTG